MHLPSLTYSYRLTREAARSNQSSIMQENKEKEGSTSSHTTTSFLAGMDTSTYARLDLLTSCFLWPHRPCGAGKRETSSTGVVVSLPFVAYPQIVLSVSLRPSFICVCIMDRSHGAQSSGPSTRYTPCILSCIVPNFRLSCQTCSRPPQ